MKEVWLLYLTYDPREGGPTGPILDSIHISSDSVHKRLEQIVFSIRNKDKTNDSYVTNYTYESKDVLDLK